MPAVVDRFQAYCTRKQQAALAAPLPGFESVPKTGHAAELIRIGNDWTRSLFDGWFYRSPNLESNHRGGVTPVMPHINLVFVQSRDGNTEADDPGTLGGGDTDKHLVYEGLSRVDADGVMAGATTAHDDELVFSVWHPELVRLREKLGKPRHPRQIIVSARANLPLDTALLYTTPSLPVTVVTTTRTAEPLRRRVADRPWIDVIDAGEPLSLEAACRELAARGCHTISAVGGRRTATALLAAGLVADLYLTTSPISAGTPNTPFYEGPELKTALVVEKHGRGAEKGVRFEHLVL
jgi:riboflavin biosynthesis pyrimidine reductase